MPEVSWKVWEELRSIRKRCKDGGELGVIESSKIRVYFRFACWERKVYQEDRQV